MANVTLKAVKKVYDGGVTAVQDFNLEIADKEFVVFVGPSGCGKSTTLRMIAGLEDITDGEIFIGDKIVNDVEPKDRDIAMVFQNYALYPHMSVYENMAFGLSLRRVPRDEIHRRVLDAAEILGITELLGRTPKALSGGQRQRVAIGRAIVRIPQVFLMDEPLSNLDAKLRNQMRAEILLLHEKINTTFIYVTHDQTEAMTLCDRIVIMKDGFIQQVGTPQQVFDDPANLFVAGFIGSPQMNFFDAIIHHVGDRSYANICGVDIKIHEDIVARFKKDLPDGSKVILGIRPEHTTLKNEGDEGAVKAKIVVSEMMGSEVYLHAVPEGSEKMIIRIPTLDLTDEQKKNLIVHNDFYFGLRGKALHFFDKESGESLTIPR